MKLNWRHHFAVRIAYLILIIGIALRRDNVVIIDEIAWFVDDRKRAFWLHLYRICFISDVMPR